MSFRRMLRVQDGEGGEPTFRHAYECLRSLLNSNTLLLEQMAEIEAALGFYLPSSPFLRRKIFRMVDETLLLVEDLNVLAGDYDSFL